MQQSNVTTTHRSLDIEEQVALLEISLQNAYRALARAEARYHDLFDNGPDMYHVIGPDGKFREANKNHAALIGYTPEEMEGKPLAELVSESSWPRVAEGWDVVLAEGRLPHLEFDLKKKDGTTLPVSASVVKIDEPGGDSFEIRCTWRDLTERKHLEDQLRQAQKMESIGQLAGGLAHDFNNLLTAITGYTQLAILSAPSEHPLCEHLNQVNAAAQRAATLTGQMLAFSRRQIINPRAINLNDLVRDAEKMLRRLISENIEIVTVLSPDLGQVNADPSQIDQVLVNMVVNARDAMPEGGEIVIETANVEVSKEQARLVPDLSPGPHVLLAITDNGTGMSKEVQARIFEPFFTTKEPGKGTGLGLSMCFGIVKQNGASITVASQEGRGTSFKIYLPRIPEEAVRQQQEVEGAITLPLGTETILLVEDDALVRSLGARVLTQHGYQVLEASDGTAALEVAKNHPGEIHLLLTDVVMPNIGVKELTSRLKTQRPQTRVLYTSGYTDEAIVHQGVLDEGIEFIEKPFSPATLLNRVRRVLEG
jgi:two-component system, cell cycle sensor histidine kinase and response regulator CckA